MAVSLPELKVAPMRQSVADLLRQALLKGSFQPGEALSEPALAAQLRVSRGPVREALLVLAEEGLVTHSHNRGFSVLQLEEQDFAEITRVRVPLEAMVLEGARKTISADQLKHLTAMKKKLMDAFRSGDFAVTTNCDLQFHSALWELGGNAWLTHALKRVMLPYFIFTMVYKRQPPDLKGAVLDYQHQLYLDYLSGRSELTAEACVVRHLQTKPGR